MELIVHAPLIFICGGPCFAGGTTQQDISKQSRRFLDSVSDNFLIQMTGEPPRRGDLLDLMLANKQGLIGDVKV